jgi:hypothetical protein
MGFHIQARNQDPKTLCYPLFELECEKGDELEATQIELLLVQGDKSSFGSRGQANLEEAYHLLATNSSSQVEEVE